MIKKVNKGQSIIHYPDQPPKHHYGDPDDPIIESEIAESKDEENDHQNEIELLPNNQMKKKYLIKKLNHTI